MRTTSLLIVVIFSWALVPAPRAQDPAPASVPAPPAAGPLVALSMIVTDKDGKGLTSIRKDELRVIENQIEQTILGIEADERPVDYVIVVDSTGSFKQFLQDAIDAAKLFVVNRRPQDEVAVVRFAGSNTIEKVEEFSTDGDLLQKALDGSYVEGGQSAVIDALYLSAQYVAEHKPNEGRRKALVVFTDGDERLSYYKLKDLVKLLNQESVQMFAIAFVTDLNNQTKPRKGQEPPRERAEKLLATLAQQSGGRVFFPETREQTVTSAAEILLHLRGQFRIKYQSTTDVTKTGLRDVEVEFATPDGETRRIVTPRAYWFGPKPSPKPEKKKKS